MKNKKVIIGLSSTLSVAVLGLGALALFTAKDDSDFKAKAGTLGIEVDDLDMTNPLNINPGDNDPSNPEDAAAGTEHIFEYTVSNLGTKSARTRHTIILTVNKGETLLDARYMCLFNVDSDELVKKIYVLEDGTEVSNLSEIGENEFVKAVKYIFLSDIFDGVGTDVKEGGPAEKENIEGVVTEEDGKVEKTYAYDFALLRGATNKYQDADFNIEVVVEAMQYRNTDESDWEAVTTVKRTYTTADVDGTYVPAQDEDSEGNKLDSEFLDHVFEKHTSSDEKPEEKPSDNETSEEESTEDTENTPTEEVTE